MMHCYKQIHLKHCKHCNQQIHFEGQQFCKRKCCQFCIQYDLMSKILASDQIYKNIIQQKTSMGPNMHIYNWKTVLFFTWKSYTKVKCTRYQSCKSSWAHFIASEKFPKFLQKKFFGNFHQSSSSMISKDKSLKK